MKGENPTDLLATVKVFINLKNVKELGLTIPPSILARVDEIIE